MQTLTVVVANLVLTSSLQGTFAMSKLPRNCLTGLKLNHLESAKHQVFDEIPVPNSQAPTNDLCPTQMHKPPSMNELQHEALPPIAHNLSYESGEPHSSFSKQYAFISGTHQLFDNMSKSNSCSNLFELVSLSEEDTQIHTSSSYKLPILHP
ncbi:hypothetical protein RND81_03G055400 [Saponaria officinalis]|uniref:Uncharacterized protein n=1 Tax=Saponaria officinalis TaxID=3572 RepID=A0AAW1M5U9_SAPOF